jgi:Asp-tRNA(Asn)/Glu-tRNA(Gln) amidotransferase A subunit family amidase
LAVGSATFDPRRLTDILGIRRHASNDRATGLPIGVLLTGGRFRKNPCLDAAEAIEARLSLDTPIDPVS